MIQKAVSEMMIDRGSEGFVMNYRANFDWKIVGIDESNTNREIALTQLDMILVPLQVDVVESQIWCHKYWFQDY